MYKIPSGAIPIGYRAIVEQFKLTVMPHFRWSYLIPTGSRRTIQQDHYLIYLYDMSYALDEPKNPLTHLVFALKHEGINFEIAHALFQRLDQSSITTFISALPNGKYHRTIWYLYEFLTNKRLPIPDLMQGTYVALLDPKEYYTTKNELKPRYRIHDNLLGNVKFCPMIRKSPALIKSTNASLSKTAQTIIQEYSASVLERASTYLYAKETTSSYQIEHEQPSKSRLARYIQLIKKTESIPTLTKETLLTLQHTIVEPRFINHDYRSTQNYIGEQRDLTYQIVHFISPKPEDVESLMHGLLQSFERMISSEVDPIIIATALSFGFVFIHPFDDGNGRLHRFLIHYILHRTKFTPKGMIFPVSAVILNNMHKYSDTLELVSKPLMECITNYDLDDQGILTVQQETKILYQYIDYTAMAEFLNDCIAQTIQTHFKDELDYIVNYDATKKALKDIVDMPDKLINLFIALVVDNEGKLSSKKRAVHFAMLSTTEIEEMEKTVKSIMLR